MEHEWKGRRIDWRNSGMQWNDEFILITNGLINKDTNDARGGVMNFEWNGLIDVILLQNILKWCIN